MALNPTGAKYRNQDAVQRKDRVLGEAMDDLASQLEQVRQQGNYGPNGNPAAPHPLTTIAVKAAGGFGTVTLTHINAPAGTRYIIEAATTPTFQSPMRIDNGISLTTLPIYLKGQTLYFRAAPMFPASDLAPWLYFGGTTTPTAVAF